MAINSIQINTFVNEFKSNWLVDFHKISKIVVGIVLLISVFLLFNLRYLKFDYDFDAFFSKQDVETTFFKEHRERFGTDNDFLFISIENSSSIYQKDFLLRVKSFVEELEIDSLVESTSDITHLFEYVKTPMSRHAIKRNYINLCEGCDLLQDSILISNRPSINSFYLNKTKTGLMVRIDHQAYLSKKKCDLLKANIDRLLEKYRFNQFHYAGRAVGQSYYIDIMKFETGFFISLSFLLVIIFLYFSFKSWWGIWLPLIIVSFSMLWIIGFMAVVGEPINIVLTVLPSIIFVVAMSDVIHLVSKYLEELRLGKEKIIAIKIAYKEVGFATLLTSVTTAIGFLSLLTVYMEPIRVFGIYTSIGVLFSFVLAYTLLPALLVLVKPPKISSKPLESNFWYLSLHFLFSKIIQKRKIILILFFGVISIAIVGFSKVESNYFLLEDLKPENEMRQQFEYFDKEYMGLRPFEMSIKTVDDSVSIYDYKVLKSINEIDSFLIHDFGLSQTFSLPTLLKIANRTEHVGQEAYYQFPEENVANQFISQIKKVKQGQLLSVLVDSSESFTRISSTLGDIGKQKIAVKNERLERFLKSNIDSTLLDVKLTGTGYLLDKNMSTLSENLTFGLLIAILIVSLLMGFLYKSTKIVLIALVPNLLPLLFLAAVLGFVGIDLKVSTAIIFTIAFGIAVDDTIHFMSKFKLELNKGKSVLYALKRTYLSTGRAILLTSLIICSGFLLLLFSDFLGTFYIGLLISLTLIFALIADLFLLPILILLFYKKKS